jgi:hypothetical protein
MRQSLIFIILGLLLAASFVFRQTTGDPATQLAQWARQDHDLGTALTNADQGNPRDLTSWLNRADEEERQRLAGLIVALISTGAGKDAEGDWLVDDRLLYRFRHRLRPFLTVSSGSSAIGQEIDLEMDNMLAYGLVAGTEQPSEQDLALARIALPRLEERMRRKPDHAVLDTIGCVYFALGDFAKAKEAFTAASQLFATTKEEGSWFDSAETVRRRDKTRRHQQALYRRRLEAATANAARNDPAVPLVPLPRDWPTAPVPATDVPAAAATPASPPPVVPPGKPEAAP